MWAKAAKRPFEALYKMYVKPWNPELAMVEMSVLSEIFLRPSVSEICLLTGTFS